MPHSVCDEAANGVEAVFLRFCFVGGKYGGLECFFDTVYGGVTTDAKASVYECVDIARVILFVELVLDVANDLFEHVFDGDESSDAAEFIHHQSHVVTGISKIT